MPDSRDAPVTITINGLTVRAPKGTMLVDAAKAAGIDIPIFCYEPRLGAPIGACRMCLVEIEGMRGLQTSCSTPVAPEMVVNTTNDTVTQAQDGVLEMLLANHPLDCPVCDKGGECPLQDQTFRFGPGESRFIEPKNPFPKPLDLSPLITLDRERCIRCYRCVRFSQEVAEDGQLTFQERGDHTEVATFSGEPYVGHFTGSTIDLCPVGALTSTPYRFVSRPWDIQNAPSVCAGCSMGCNVELTQRDGQVKRLAGRPEPNMAVEEGWICDRGRWAFPALNASDRISHPELLGAVVGRRRVPIERAVGEAAARLMRPGARTAILLGDPVTVEEGFLALEVAERMGGAMVRRLGIPGHGLGPLRALDPAQMNDVDGADLVVVVGGDPGAQQPVAELRIRKARRDGARVVVVGPRPSALDDIAETLRTVPGRLADAATAIEERLAGTERAVVFFDEADLAAEPDAADALARLVGATPGARVIEMCADVSGPGLRALGIRAEGLLEALETSEIDVLITVHADPLRGAGGARWSRAIDGVATVIEMSAFRTALSDRADVTIPLLATLEQEGVLVSMAGRAQRLRPGARGPEGAAPGWEALVGLSHRLGEPVPDRTPAQAFARVAERFPAFTGLSYEVLGVEGVPITRVPAGPATAARVADGDGLVVVPTAPVFGDATTHRSDALDCVLERSHVGLAPGEATRLGLGDAEHVRVVTPHGEAVLPLVVDARLHEAGIYVVMGDPQSGAAQLLPPDHGPVCATLTAVVGAQMGAA